VLAGGLVGLRLAGSPAYTEGEQVELSSLEDEFRWSVEARFVRQEREVAFFEPASGWYREERRATPRYPTRLAVTIVAPGEAYLARGTALDMSEGGMKVAVPEEPAGKNLRILMPEADGVSLPCHVVGISYGDTGVELHLAYMELTDDNWRFVRRRVADLRVIAERGRDLLAS
jgi:hypothetical protein